MITYILGNSIIKRTQFSRINNEEEVYIDDLHISCDVVRNGIYCYATECRPFKNMRVCDFVLYSRSLFDNEINDVKQVKKIMRSVGYRGCLTRKLSTVNKVDYLRTLIASRIKDTTRTVYFNLDEWRYSAKSAKRMQKLFNGLTSLSICVLVSDMRFCEYGSDVLYLTTAREFVKLDGVIKRKRTSKRRVLSMLKHQENAG